MPYIISSAGGSRRMKGMASGQKKSGRREEEKRHRRIGGSISTLYVPSAHGIPRANHLISLSPLLYISTRSLLGRKSLRQSLRNPFISLSSNDMAIRGSSMPSCWRMHGGNIHLAGSLFSLLPHSRRAHAPVQETSPPL